MKIFHCVESYNPSIGGMQEVVKQLSERLVQLGHDVTVLTRFDPDRDFTKKNGVKVLSFQIEGNPLSIGNKYEQEYVDFLLTHDSDIVTFFAAQQWATNLALPFLKNIKAKKVSVPTGYSGLYSSYFNDYFYKMKTYIHDYDMNVYLSNNYRDINFARENVVKSIIVIPNGAAADEFMADSKINIRKVLKIHENNFLILHVGSYTKVKGHKEAIDIFFKSKIKNANLLLIGNNYKSFYKDNRSNLKLFIRIFLNRILYNKRFIFKNFSREYTVEAYKQSDLFLFPSNIECSPIVLFECAAAKLCYLASDVGNSVEITDWISGGLIIPTEKNENSYSNVVIKDAVNMLNDIYLKTDERIEMGNNAFNIWKEKFSWEIIAKEYEKMYLNLINK